VAEARESIEQEEPAAAKRMADRIREAVEYLVDYPNLGRPGRVEQTRELVVSGTPFLVIYRVREREIHILRVLHHARRWPPR
jgi:plasmid stabilization system protein ParE